MSNAKRINPKTKLESLLKEKETSATGEKVLFSASVGEMPAICGSASDAIEVRMNAERSALKKELKKLGYDDIDPKDCINGYHWHERRRKVFNEAKRNVKHIGDAAVKKWTDRNIKMFIEGKRKVQIEPMPMKTQYELDQEAQAV